MMMDDIGFDRFSVKIYLKGGTYAVSMMFVGDRSYLTRFNTFFGIN